jgi:hypothetical protein
VASNRPFATSRSSGRTSVFRQAPLAAWKVILAGTEWAAYYDELASAFGLTIDVTGPGPEPLLDTIAVAPDLATLVGEQTHLAYPPGWDLRRIPVRDPVPVYPHSLLWLGGNPHPALTALREHLAATAPTRRRDAGTWTPAWAATAATAVTARR